MHNNKHNSKVIHNNRGIDKDSDIKIACVPFPQPGGPNNIIRN